MMIMKAMWKKKMLPNNGICAPASDLTDLLINRIIQHEGIKNFAYHDSLGYLTIGIGRCIQEKVGKGLSTSECMYLLRNDIAEFHAQLMKYNWFVMQDEVRQDALVELAFNMGVAHLLGFKQMIDALTKQSYQGAAKELINSAWSKQVGASRASDLAWRIQYGRYQ